MNPRRLPLYLVAATCAGFGAADRGLHHPGPSLSHLRDPDAPRLTALKPRVYEQVGSAKTRQLERVRPATLVGNIRVEIELHPTGPLWPADSGPVFNAAEAGPGLFTAWRMLQEAIAVGPPRTAVLGLDIFDFLSTRDGAATGPPPVSSDERRLLVGRDGEPNPARAAQIWRHRLTTTLTIDALLDSVETVLDQNPETSVTMTPEGFNPLHDYRLLVARSGYRELFAQKTAIYEAQYRHYVKSDFSDPGANAGFRNFERILQTARAHHVALVLYIHPYHADYLGTLHRVGLWDSFEAWKRALVKVIERTGDGRPAAVRLLDFSGDHAYTTEAVPDAGDRRAEMRWYWEPGHYKSTLGDLCPRRVYSMNAFPGGFRNGAARSTRARSKGLWLTSGATGRLIWNASPRRSPIQRL